MKNIRQVLVVLLLLYVSIGVVPTFTFAHANIIASSPSENETLVKAPSVVTVEFDEEIEPKFDSFFVVDSKGTRVDTNEASFDKNNSKRIQTKLKDQLPNGAYTIQWKAVSADGHPVEGTIPFQIGAGTGIHSMQSTTGYVPQADMIINRGLLYTGFSLFLGVILFHLVFYKGESSNILKAKSKTMILLSLLLIACSLLWNLPLQAKLYGNVPWSQAFQPSLWREVLGIPPFGYVWISQIILLVLLVIASWLALTYGAWSSLKAWLLPVLLLIGLFVTKALMGHAASSTYRDIAVVIDVLHLCAASIWVGSVAAIVFLLSKQQEGKRDWSLYWDTIERFSPWAMTATITILFTGIFSITLYIPDLRSIFQTSYGLILLAKIILFVGMGMLGIVHIVKRKLRKEKELGVSVQVEFGIGIAVLIAAAILTNVATPPLPVPVPFNETKQVSIYEVAMHISPNAVGPNTFEIDITDQHGQPVTNIEGLTITMYSLDMEMGRNIFTLPMVSPGKYQVEGKPFNMEGNWKVAVQGTTFSHDTFEVEFRPSVGRVFAATKK